MCINIKKYTNFVILSAKRQRTTPYIRSTANTKLSTYQHQDRLHIIVEEYTKLTSLKHIIIYR